MDPAGGIIMLAGIYYGAKYGGSTTSILLNIPGESSSVVTCIDGYQMARKGRAGAALGIAAIASFIAGTVGVIALTLIAPPVAAFALSFSSPEYFALMCLGLALVVLLSGPSLIKGLLSLLVGLWLTSIGTDCSPRRRASSSGRATLLGGIDFMVVAIGVFAIARGAGQRSRPATRRQMLPVPRGIRNLLPNWEELKACRFAFLNGSVTGFMHRLSCRAPAPPSPRSSPTASRRRSRSIRRNSATARRKAWRRRKAPTMPTPAARWCRCSRSAFPAAARPRSCCRRWCCGACKPGPLMMQESPDVFWGLVASMYIGNVVLLILNLPLVPLFAQILRLPVYVLFPIILGISMVGAYGASGRMFDLGLLVGFGLLGYVMVQAEISRRRR